MIVALQLLALAYVGFYAWGLAMSVFTPSELGWMSILAAVLAVAVAVSLLVVRRARARLGKAELARQAAHLRERRGF
jgi:hypothetical protein